MKYLIDAEYWTRNQELTKQATFPFAAHLRDELSRRNMRWAVENGQAHEVSMGRVPSVLYREDESGNHGNFSPATYRLIQATPEWQRRLSKVHTSARRVLLSHDPGRNELDSCNSSDALLMNVFCDPETLAEPGVRHLLGIEPDVKPVFGFRPYIPLASGQRDRTEIDMKLGDLYIEAKLTEYDFQTAPRRLIERYRDLTEVFDLGQLEATETTVRSYQLLRNVLATYADSNTRFCVLCDRRRPDLIDAWYKVMTAVKPYTLRSRLQLLTWQELVSLLPARLAAFLDAKYGLLQENGM